MNFKCIIVLALVGVASAAFSNEKSTGAEVLSKWCYSSQLSQPELTKTFKQLVSIVKSSPSDSSLEAAAMSERICQGSLVEKSSETGNTIANRQVDAKAHELVKDAYMDALVACKSRDCLKQLTKLVSSNKVEPMRAAYYMTRIAMDDEVAEHEDSIVEMVESVVLSNDNKAQFDIVVRQKMLAATSLLGKAITNNNNNNKINVSQIKPTIVEVAKKLVQEYIKPVIGNKQQLAVMQPEKIAQFKASLKAIANLAPIVDELLPEVSEICTSIIKDKSLSPSMRQSAVECLEQSQKSANIFKQTVFADWQSEPTELRVAALRALIKVQGEQCVEDQTISQLVQHCEENGQSQDDQFCHYAMSHLDNVRVSQKDEYQPIVKAIAANKQLSMQIQVLNKKFSQQADLRKSSRNYMIEQQVAEIETGLMFEGDLVYESKQKQAIASDVLPKLIRVNMSMPVAGKTINVVELTIRQNQMDKQLGGLIGQISGSKFNVDSVSKIVGSFQKSIVNQQPINKHTGSSTDKPEADLTIKVDGQTVVYVCSEDLKGESSAAANAAQWLRRSTRSISSGSDNLLQDLVNYIKRNPININRGFNFNLNQSLGKVIDIDANVIAGLRLQSHAQQYSAREFEIMTSIEPRFAYESIVGPSASGMKKFLSRFSTKTALGLRLKFKLDELVDVSLDLPLNSMELFTIENQIVESSKMSSAAIYSNRKHGNEFVDPESDYAYSKDSIYKSNSIYSNKDDFMRMDDAFFGGIRLQKRSIFSSDKSTYSKIKKFINGKSSIVGGSKFFGGFDLETPSELTRATGLKAKLRVVAKAPVNFVARCVIDKDEPSMRGYHLQIKRIAQGSRQDQYIVSVSTPGSRLDRTIQVRLVKSLTQQRSLVKADWQSARLAFTTQMELVHDGRQYAAKFEVSSSSRQQWRHLVEFGVQRGSQSPAGRIATTYKPYVNVDSTYLRRPIQLQGVFSYQQQPKSVIVYELSCPSSGDFVKGKLILDTATNNKQSMKKHLMVERSSMSRRSWMSSIKRADSWAHLIDAIVDQVSSEFTVTFEMVGQLQQHALKLHKMLDWNLNRGLVSADMSYQHKNLRRSNQDVQLVGKVQIDSQRQVVSIDKRSSSRSSKDFVLTIVSELKSNLHQLVAELVKGDSSNDKQKYEHKIEFNCNSASKFDVQGKFELLDTKHRYSEAFGVRTQVDFGRHMKSSKFEIRSLKDQKFAKLSVDFVSFAEHLIEAAFQGDRISHQCKLEANKNGRFIVESQTKRDGRSLAELVVEKMDSNEAILVKCNVPQKDIRVLLKLALVAGQQSTYEIQSNRFTARGELLMENAIRGASKLNRYFKRPFFTNNYRFKSDLKDRLNQDQYLIDSNWSVEPMSASYLRFDSPLYRTNFEMDPSKKSTKFGLFARKDRAQDLTYDKLAKSAADFDSSISTGTAGSPYDWIMSAVHSELGNELKQRFRRSTFEYVDDEQTHRHQYDWNPSERRFNLDWDHKPSSKYTSNMWQPLRMRANINCNYDDELAVKPSSLSLNSQWFDFDLDTKPSHLFLSKPSQNVDSYARWNLLARYPRSAIKSHKGDWRKSDKGLKASMDFEDQQSKRHTWSMEADKNLKRWARMQMDSDKYGKGLYEHSWRKHLKSKRSPSVANDDDDQYYQNYVSLKAQGNKSSFSPAFEHETRFDWDEPKSHLHRFQQRIRRSTTYLDAATTTDELLNAGRYGYLDYLKHIGARLNSQTLKNKAQMYKLDFDYQPESAMRMSMSLPESELLHSSSIEYEPTKQIYKLKSQLINSRTQEPSYQLLASTKPYTTIPGLATAEQEPVYTTTSNTMRRLLDQPIDFEFSDNKGRLARFNYDHSPESSQILSGLRRKRAAIYYKDDYNNEHSSEFDFYPSSRHFMPSDLKLRSKFGAGFTLKAGDQPGTVVASIDGHRYNGKMIVDFVNKVGSIVVSGPQRFLHETRIVRVAQDVYQVESMTTSKKGRPLVKLSAKASPMVFKELEHLFLSRYYAGVRSPSPSSSQIRQHISTLDLTVYEPKEYQISAKFDCLNKEAKIVAKNVDDKRVQETLVKVDDSYNKEPTVIVNSRLIEANSGKQVYTSSAVLKIDSIMQGRCLDRNCASDFAYTTDSTTWGARLIPGEKLSLFSPYGKQVIPMVY